MRRVAGVAPLPVMIDDRVQVLLGYDAQGPDRWSIGGALYCDATP